MKIINGIIKDFVKSIAWGSIAMLFISVFIGIISLLATKFDLIKSLEIIRSALLIVGPFLMLISAFLIIKKTNEKKLEYIDDWKMKFNVFSYKVVLIIISFTITIYGSLIDFIIFNI